MRSGFYLIVEHWNTKLSTKDVRKVIFEWERTSPAKNRHSNPIKFPILIATLHIRVENLDCRSGSRSRTVLIVSHSSDRQLFTSFVAYYLCSCTFNKITISFSLTTLIATACLSTNWQCYSQCEQQFKIVRSSKVCHFLKKRACQVALQNWNLEGAKFSNTSLFWVAPFVHCVTNGFTNCNVQAGF